MFEISPYTVDIRGLPLVIRTLSGSDADGFITMVSRMRWCPSVAELKAGFSCFPRAYLGAFTSEGELVCACSCTTCGDAAVIPFFITDEAYRGKGVGRFIFNQVHELITASSIFLTSVPDMVGFYYKYGYKATGERQYDLEFTTGPQTPGDVAQTAGVEIVNVGASVMDAVVEYDDSLAAARVDRREYAREIWAADDSVKFGAVATRGGKTVGTISLRSHPNHPGKLKVIMFYADSPDIAAGLLQSAIDSQAESITYKLLISDKNFKNVQQLLKRFDLDLADLVAGVDPYVTCCKGEYDERWFQFDKIYGRSGHMADIY